MTTIAVRPGELIVEYGGERVTLRYLSETTGIEHKYLWVMFRRGRLTVANVMEYQRKKRVQALARANGLSWRQVQHRIERGMSPVEAATKPLRSYTRKVRGGEAAE